MSTSNSEIDWPWPRYIEDLSKRKLTPDKIIWVYKAVIGKKITASLMANRYKLNASMIRKWVY